MNQSYDLGPFVDEHYVLLRHVLTNYRPKGYAMEFGVGSGMSTRMIAQWMPVIGFDSFEGLPEDWRPGFPKGTFACEPPVIPDTRIVKGLFENTLPWFRWGEENWRPLALVHIDCDLYSSTQTVLKYVGPHLKKGCFIVFDEFHGYEGAEMHEQRAWREFAADTRIQWDVIGHSFQQWSVRIA